MKNDTRNRVFTGHGKAPNISRLSVCIGSLLVVGQAWADAGLPPPVQHQGAGFPSERALQQKGYDPKTGVWRVQSQNNGRPTVTKDGGTIKGTQGKTVTVTGKYGEKGVMKTTQTQTVSSSKLQTAVNGLWIGSTVSNAVEKFGPVMGSRIRAGDYKGAFESAVLMAGDIGNGLTFGIPQSLGSLGGYLGINPSPQEFRDAGDRFYKWQIQKEQGGNLGGAIANAAAKKAAEGAAKAAEGDKAYKEAKKQQSEGKEVYQVVMSYTDYGIKPVKSQIVRMGAYTDKSSNKYGTSYATYDNKGGRTIVRSSIFDSYLPKSLSGGGAAGVGTELVMKETPPPETVKPEDMTLNQQDIKDILARMLNNQQTNHEELMNQLSRIGDAVEKSTESNQFTPMTADSAPYTPQGSNTPQQTRFQLNADGSVTTSIIPRPDLKPNSTTAPTRSEIIPTPNKAQDNPTTPNNPDSPNKPTTPNQPTNPNEPSNPTGQQGQNQNQEQQKQDFCQQNPNAAQCLEAGDSSYEDIQLPEQTIDLDFKPLNVFQSDGTCPAPRSVDFGALGQVEFSYDPLCDLARKLRPIFIAICVLTCTYFVYESVKEL